MDKRGAAGSGAATDANSGGRVDGQRQLGAPDLEEERAAEEARIPPGIVRAVGFRPDQLDVAVQDGGSVELSLEADLLAVRGSRLRADLDSALEAPAVARLEDLRLQWILVEIVPRDLDFREVGVVDVAGADPVLDDVARVLLGVEVLPQVDVELQGVLVPGVGSVLVRDDVVILGQHEHIEVFRVGGDGELEGTVLGGILRGGGSAIDPLARDARPIVELPVERDRDGEWYIDDLAFYLGGGKGRLGPQRARAEEEEAKKERRQRARMLHARRPSVVEWNRSADDMIPWQGKNASLSRRERSVGMEGGTRLIPRFLETLFRCSGIFRLFRLPKSTSMLVYARN